MYPILRDILFGDVAKKIKLIKDKNCDCDMQQYMQKMICKLIYIEVIVIYLLLYWFWSDCYIGHMCSLLFEFERCITKSNISLRF